MNIKLAYKLKNGIVFTTDDVDCYEFIKDGQGDFLRLMIKGKLDNKDMTLKDPNGAVKHKYNELSSIEIIFSE